MVAENMCEMTGEQVSDYLSTAGRRMQERAQEIVTEMFDLLAGNIAPLDEDPKLREMLWASIDGNVSTLCHIFVNDIGVESMQPNTGAVEYAVRLAQHDVPLSALTRAYYLGQSLLVRWAIDVADTLEIESRQEKMHVVRSAVDVVHRYIDWILKYVTEAYEAEQRRWWAKRSVGHASAVRKVLRSEQISTVGFEAETGYSLSQRHVAVICWLEFDGGDTEDQRRVDHLLRKLATVLGAGNPPLISAQDDMTARAWFGVSTSRFSEKVRAGIGELYTSEEARGIRLAVGDPADGEGGFRVSHQQAAKARLVALGAPAFRNAQTVAFSDPSVALTSLLLQDSDGAMSWTKDVLGPVAEEGEENASLRETLSAFYLAGENYTRTAENLGLHRNTVRHRVSRFEAGREKQAVDPLEVALALRILQLLGDID